MVLICCSAIDRHCFLQPGRQQGPATWSKPSPEVGHYYGPSEKRTPPLTQKHTAPLPMTPTCTLQHVSAHAFVCERTCTQVISVTTSPRAQLSAYARPHTHTHARTRTRAHGHTGTHAHVQRQSLLRQGRPANTTSQFVPAEHGVSTFAGPPPRFSLDPSMAKISAAGDHARWPQWSSP